MHDYAGCIHFHSEYSYDARTPLPAIAEAALRVGLDYAVVTDHFRLEAQKAGGEQWYARAGKSFLMLTGEEVSPRYNHYLAFNIQKPVVVWKTHAQPQTVIDAVNAQGGFGFIAHPDHRGAPLVGMRAYPWIDWSVKGYAGLSIWDLIGDWSSALTSHPRVLWAHLFPSRYLHGPHKKTLARWDTLTQAGHCVAIGELDNHANRRSFLFFQRRIFPFDFAFRTLRTHVLLPEPLKQDVAADRAAIFNALRQGRSYVSLDLWNDPKGFSFEVFNDQRRATMGETFERQGPGLLAVKIPSRGNIRLIRNGELIWLEKKRAYLEQDLDRPGVYRIEVDQEIGGRMRPWIFSNPIWVK